MAAIMGYKTALLSGAVVVGGVAIGALIAPALIDINAYKPRVIDGLSKALGRSVAIDGDLGFSVLPYPSVTLAGVRIANRRGGSEADVARLDLVTVQLSVASLFSGTLRAQSVVLDQPRLLLEQTDDGASWDFSAASQGQGADPAARVVVPSAGAGGGNRAKQPEATSKFTAAFDMAVDEIEVRGGAVVYRSNDQDFRLGDITLVTKAQSLNGPFKVSGQMHYQKPGAMIGPGAGVPLTFDASMGVFRDDFSVPLSLHLGVLNGDGAPLLQTAFSGMLAGSSSGRTLRGDLTASASQGEAVGQAFGSQVVVAPGPLSMRASLVAGTERFSVEGLQADVGGTHAEGALSWDGSGETGRINGRLVVGSLDLDRWLLASPTTEGGKSNTTTAAAGTAAPSPAAEPAAVAASGGRHEANGGALIPTTWRGAVDVRMEAVTWKGRAMRQGHVALSFDEQGVSLQEATVLLPGSASLTAVGRLLPAHGDVGGVGFDVAVEAQADNLRDFLAWQNVALSGINPARLTRAQVSASVGGTLAELTIPDLEAVIDTTALRGAATVRLPRHNGDRPGIGLTVQAAKINLDSYRPPKGASAKKTDTGTESKTGAESGSSPAETRPAVAPATTDAGWWRDIDANVHLAAQTLVWNDVPFQGGVLKGSLIQGRLEIEDLHVDDIAGGALAAHGVLAPHGDRWQQAVVEGMTVSLSSPAPHRTARALGLSGLETWNDGETLSVEVSASGPLASPNEPLSVTLSSKAGGGEAVLHGQISQALLLPTIEGSLSLKAPDAVRLLRLFTPAYRPAAALGAVSAQTDLSVSLTAIKLSNLSLVVGQDRVAGDLALALGLGRPKLTATLHADALSVDRFLSGKRTAALGGVMLAMAGGVSDGAPQVAVGAVHPRWSTSPLDLAALSALDADLTLSADRLQASGFSLQSLSTVVALNKGVLLVKPFKATLYGGPMTAALSLDAPQGQQARLSLVGSVEGANAGRLLGALENASDSVASVAGVGSLSLDLTANGTSEAGLIQTLSGAGQFDFSGLNLNDKANQILVLKPLLALNKFASIGMNNQASAARIQGGLEAKDGIVSLRSVDVSSVLYHGRLQGIINLPLWTLDIDGQVRMSDSMVAALLRKKLKLPEVVPVSLSGDLDRPMVRVLGGQPLGTAANGNTPSAQEVLPGLLNKYLGDGAKENPSPSAEPEVKPEKAARDLLRGLLQQ